MAQKQQKGALLNPTSQNDPKVRRFGLRKVQLRIYGLVSVLILTLILIGILEYVNRTLPGGSKTRYSAGLATRDLSSTGNHPALAIRDDPSATTTQIFVPLSTTATITSQCPSLLLTCACPPDEIEACNCNPDPAATFCTCVVKVIPSCECDPLGEAECECGPDPFYRDCVCPPDSKCNRCMCPSSSGSFYEPCDCPADPFAAGCTSSPRAPVCGEGSLQECGCSVVEEWRCGVNTPRSDCTAATTSFGGVSSSIVTVVPVFSTENSSITSPSVVVDPTTFVSFTPTSSAVLTPSGGFVWVNGSSTEPTSITSRIGISSDVILGSGNASDTPSLGTLSSDVLPPSANTMPTNGPETEGESPIPSSLDDPSPTLVASTPEPTFLTSSVVPAPEPSNEVQSPIISQSGNPPVSTPNLTVRPTISSQVPSPSAQSSDPTLQSSDSPTPTFTLISSLDPAVGLPSSPPVASLPATSPSILSQTSGSLPSSSAVVSSGILVPFPGSSLFPPTSTPAIIETGSEGDGFSGAISTTTTSSLGAGAIILVSSSLVTLSSGPVSFSAVAVTFFQTTPTGLVSVITDSSGNIFTIPSQILVSSLGITPAGSIVSSLASEVNPTPSLVPDPSIPQATVAATLNPVSSGSVTPIGPSASPAATGLSFASSDPFTLPSPPSSTNDNLKTGVQSSLQPTGSFLMTTAQSEGILSVTAAAATSSSDSTSAIDLTPSPNSSIPPQSLSISIPTTLPSSPVNSIPGSNPSTMSQIGSGSGFASSHASPVNSIATSSPDVLSTTGSASFSAIPISQEPSNTEQSGSPTSRGGSSGVHPPTSSATPGSGSGSITVAVFSWPVSKTVLGGYVPVVLARLVLWAWTMIYEPLVNYETIHQLSRQHGAPSSILFGTGLSLWYVWPAQIAAWLISPFAAELVYFDTNYGCANPNLDTPANPCWPPRTSVNSWVVRVLETLLSAVALTVVVIIALWFKRPAGRAVDPASIAAVAAVMGHPEIERDFKSFDSEISTKELRDELRYKQYQLGTYHTELNTERYGIVPAAASEQQNQLMDSINLQNGLPSATTVSKMKMAFTSVKNWKMFQMWRDIVFMLYLFGLIGAAILYMTRIDNLTTIHLLDNSSVGRRILFAFFACIACSYWTRLQRDAQTLAPYSELAYPNEAAPSPSILLQKRSLALVAIFPLFRHFHIVAGCTALTAVLSEFLVITFSGLPYRPGQLRSEFLFCGITSLVLLVLMLFMLVVVNVWRMFFIPRLPRKPDNMAAIMTYVCDSKMNEDFEGLEKVDVKERNKKIVGLRKRYRYGERKCQDGRRRWVVDEVGDRLDSEN